MMSSAHNCVTLGNSLSIVEGIPGISYLPDGTLPWGSDMLTSLKVCLEASPKYEYYLNTEFTTQALPIPQSAADCNPSDPATAPDSYPYLMARPLPIALPASFTDATGFIQVGFDYLQCGHPALGVFTKPHLDVHFYLENASERTEWTCTPVAGFPNCAPEEEQPTESDKKFYQLPVANANVPSDYVLDVESGGMFQGFHWTPPDPVHVDEWTESTLIMVTYDFSVLAFEPMIPLVFTQGADAKRYLSEKLVYSEQTIELPSGYAAVYDPSSELTTVSVWMEVTFGSTGGMVMVMDMGMGGRKGGMRD